MRKNVHLMKFMEFLQTREVAESGTKSLLKMILIHLSRQGGRGLPPESLPLSSPDDKNIKCTPTIKFGPFS